MRHYYATIFLAGLCTALSAQVPNGGFENWTGNVPNSWSTNNIAPLNFYTITPSADAHSGSLAARGTVMESPISAGQAVPPTLQSLAAPVTSDPGAVSGWYKFSPTQATTQFVIGVSVIDINGQITGIGNTLITAAAPNYTQFNMPINYDIGQDDPAASVTISFIIADNVPAGSIGSWYQVDDLAFNMAQGIAEREWTAGSLGMPYPSPSNGSSTVELTVNREERLRVEVLDATGRTVEQLVDGLLPAGTHRLVWNPSVEVANGTYLLRVSGATGSVSRRLLLQR